MKFPLTDDVFCGPSCVFTNDLTPRAAYPKGRENYKKTCIKKGRQHRCERNDRMRTHGGKICDGGGGSRCDRGCARLLSRKRRAGKSLRKGGREGKFTVDCVRHEAVMGELVFLTLINTSKEYDRRCGFTDQPAFPAHDDGKYARRRLYRDRFLRSQFFLLRGSGSNRSSAASLLRFHSSQSLPLG